MQALTNRLLFQSKTSLITFTNQLLLRWRRWRRAYKSWHDRVFELGRARRKNEKRLHLNRRVWPNSPTRWENGELHARLDCKGIYWIFSIFHFMFLDWRYSGQCRPVESAKKTRSPEKVRISHPTTTVLKLPELYLIYKYHCIQKFQSARNISTVPYLLQFMK